MPKPDFLIEAFLRTNVGIRPPMPGARLAAERGAELYGWRRVHTAAIRGPMPMAPWSPGRSGLEAFGAQGGFVVEN